MALLGDLPVQKPDGRHKKRRDRSMAAIRTRKSDLKAYEEAFDAAYERPTVSWCPFEEMTHWIGLDWDFLRIE